MAPFPLQKLSLVNTQKYGLWYQMVQEEGVLQSNRKRYPEISFECFENGFCDHMNLSFSQRIRPPFSNQQWSPHFLKNLKPYDHKTFLIDIV